MGKVIFAYDNWLDLAATTVTVSSEAAGFPKENMADDLYLRHWRSTGDAAEWAKWDLGDPKTPEILIVYYHNFTSAAALVLEGHASDAWGAPTYQETVPITTGLIIFPIVPTVGSPSTNFKYWRITIADGANPDTYVRIGRPFLGPDLNPIKAYTLPHEKEYPDPSDVRESGGGQKFVDEKEQYGIFPYEFFSPSEADMLDFLAMWEVVGRKKPFFICEDKTGTPYLKTYYVRSESNWKFRHIIKRLDGDLYHISNMVLAKER